MSVQKSNREYERLERPMKGVMSKPKLEQSVMASAGSLKGLTPRFVARTLGLDVGNVTACFKRQEALGLLESYSVMGEKYWRISENDNR